MSNLSEQIATLESEHTSMKSMLDQILHTMTMFDNREALLNGEREACSRLLEIFDNCYEQHNGRRPIIWDRRTNVLLNMAYRIKKNPNSSDIALAECDVILGLDLRSSTDGELKVFTDTLADLETQ